MYISTIRFDDFPIPARGGTAVAGLGRTGQPTPVSCSPEPGEIAASHTDAGILPKDVTVDDKGVLVADFGVNDRSVKKAAKAELDTFVGPTPVATPARSTAQSASRS